MAGAMAETAGVTPAMPRICSRMSQKPNAAPSQNVEDPVVEYY